MTDKKKRELKDGVVSIFKRFNILDHTSTIGNLRDDILRYIDSLQEEPVSEDLEEASVEWFNSVKYKSDLSGTPINAFKAGAQWQKDKLPKWKKTSTGGCWSGEIGVKPSQRKFTYEHYSINADKLFKLLDKED